MYNITTYFLQYTFVAKSKSKFYHAYNNIFDVCHQEKLLHENRVFLLRGCALAKSLRQACGFFF